MSPGMWRTELLKSFDQQQQGYQESLVMNARTDFKMGVGSLLNSIWRSCFMAVRSPSKSRRKAQPHALHKPRGVIHPRVQAVGPEHFAIVCVDCAKARSKMILAD